MGASIAGRVSWGLALLGLASAGAARPQTIELSESIEPLGPMESGGAYAQASTAEDFPLRLSGWAGAAMQFQEVSGDDTERGALLFRPELEYTLSERSRLRAVFGFSSGDSLDNRTPFLQSQWAADLDGTTENVNGSGRDNLLIGYYQHDFPVHEESVITLTGGLIDSTEYLDQNAFSNDELSQFMNTALVNGPNAFAPSYDLGAVFQLSWYEWSFDAVFMRIESNEIGRTYDFTGLQLGYHTLSSLGEGNYRFYVAKTTDEFEGAGGDGFEPLVDAQISFDQELGPYVGIWTRTGLGSRDAAVDAANLYSGGVHLNGDLWGRDWDELGLGVARLDQGNTGVRSSFVTEGYYSLGWTEDLAFTLSAQYLRDRFDAGAGENVDGWVLGVRLGYSF